MTYLVENQVASNSNFPFQLIAIAFGALNVFFGILWFNLGFSLDEDEKEEVFGTLEIADSFFLSLQMLTTGGYDDAVPGFAFRIVYFFMIFSGLIVFAILIGFLTDSVTGYMDSLKEGSTRVFERNHTLILGWNESTCRVVIQACFLRRQYQKLNEEKYPWLYYLNQSPFTLSLVVSIMSVSLYARFLPTFCCLFRFTLLARDGLVSSSALVPPWQIMKLSSCVIVKVRSKCTKCWNKV